jgi:hypothetical protein
MNALTIDRELPIRAVRPRVVILTLLIAAGVLVLLGAENLKFSGLWHHSSYKYEIRGSVKSASDGAALSGVILTLKLNPLGRSSKSASETLHRIELSKEDGSFLIQSQISNYEFSNLPIWVLHLTKPGYAETLVDISQHGEPKSGSPPYLIAVVAYMRPNPPGAAPHAEGAFKNADAR